MERLIYIVVLSVLGGLMSGIRLNPYEGKQLYLGEIYLSPRIKESIISSEKAAEYVYDCLTRHSYMDWGNVDDEDWEANDYAVSLGSPVGNRVKLKEGRVFSVYIVPDSISSLFMSKRIWIITEPYSYYTTILYPNEC